MVWSWTLHICTDAPEHVVHITGTARDLAREKCEVPLMTVAEPVCPVYADNINVHGISPESCDRRHDVIIAALEARGFSLHEISRASQQHKQVARVLRHDSRRLWRVHLALRCLLRMSGALSPGRANLTGHLVHIFSSARPLLSALHRLYQFQAHPPDGGDSLALTWQNFVLWPEWSGGRPFSHVVFCSDATLRRHCVQCTTAPFMELKEATRSRERWRFRAQVSHTLQVRYADGIARLGASSPLGGHSCDDPKEQDVSYQVANFGRAANFEEESTRYGAWLDSQGLRTRRTSVRASSPKAMEIEECVGAIRRLPLARSDPSRWHTIVEGNFQLKEAIRMKEGRAALMDLRRAVAGTAGHGHRFLSLHGQHE